MRKQFTHTILDRNTGKEIKKQLKIERLARIRAEAIKARASKDEWRDELRRLGFK